MKNESQASFLYNRILYSGTELIVPIPCLNIYVENVYHLENKNNFQKEGKIKIKDKFENGDNRTHEDNHRMAIPSHKIRNSCLSIWLEIIFFDSLKTNCFILW